MRRRIIQGPIQKGHMPSAAGFPITMNYHGPLRGHWQIITPRPSGDAGLFDPTGPPWSDLRDYLGELAQYGAFYAYCPTA